MKMYIEHYTDKNAIEQLTDINVILQSWEMFCKHFDYKPDEKKFPKYNPGDVIDEEKSVKWNREEVERRMDARTKEKKQLRALHNELNSLYEKRKYHNTDTPVHVSRLGSGIRRI